jgi:hypothetical protein
MITETQTTETQAAETQAAAATDPQAIGYVLAHQTFDGLAARTKSYSSYQGRSDTLTTNALGQVCQRYQTRALQVWKTPAGAAKHVRDGEFVLALYPNDPQLREQIRLRLYERDTLAAILRLLATLPGLPESP